MLMGGLATHDFEQRFLGILKDETRFPGPKRVELMKLIAEAKCDTKKYRRKDLPPEQVEQRKAKCLKRQLLATWWQLRTEKEVSVKGITVKAVGKDLVLEKEAASSP